MTGRRFYPSAGLMIFFEVLAGIALLLNPIGAAELVITVFGLVLLVIGVRELFRFLRERGDGVASALPPSVVVAVVLGLICTFASGAIIGLLSAVVLVVGVVLGVTAIIKISAYMDAKRAGFPVSRLTLCSAVLSLVCGVIVFFNPVDSLELVGRLAGVTLLVDAAMDAGTLYLLK